MSAMSSEIVEKAAKALWGLYHQSLLEHEPNEQQDVMWEKATLILTAAGYPDLLSRLLKAEAERDEAVRELERFRYEAKASHDYKRWLESAESRIAVLEEALRELLFVAENANGQPITLQPEGWAERWITAIQRARSARHEEGK
jgi:hypothetical protein